MKMRAMVLPVLLVLAACAPQVPETDRGEARSDRDVVHSFERGEVGSVPDDFRIELRRTPCFGTCPIYTVQVDADGSVLYEGAQHVATEGARHAEASPEAVARLWAGVQSGFFDLDERYEYGHPGCASYVTDMPGIVLTVRAEGREHRVYLDGGCEGAPRLIGQLALEVDEVAGSDRWVESG
jgi:hypothetical protein